MAKKSVPVDPALCSRIKEIREELSLNQAEFAALFEIEPSVISDIERGKNEPSKQMVRKLIELFDYSGTWIFTGTPPKKLHNVEIQDKAIRPEHIEQAYVLIKEGLNKHKLPVTSEAFIIGFVAEALSLGQSQEAVLKDVSNLVQRVIEQRRSLHRK